MSTPKAGGHLIKSTNACIIQAACKLYRSLRAFWFWELFMPVWSATAPYIGLSGLPCIVKVSYTQNL